ncbi:MAG: fused MFS/spermidine synthase, partial [Roseobacter sp.]
LRALSSVVATMQTVFPVVEVWTEQVQPSPGQRMVFVVVGGNARTQVDAFIANSPDQRQFGALADALVAQLADRRGQILTDDYAPIDRLMGRID